MITRETDYSMRMVLSLAGHYKRGEKTVSSADVAGEMDIPYRFLRKLVKRLVDGGLIESRRGKNGGVGLARDPSLITLFDVVQATGPRGVEMSPCISEPKSCKRSPLCQLLREFQVIQGRVDSHLKRVRISDMCKPGAR
ncbi:MAG: Rrf2 family transcriptional regulator [bacterium]